MRRRRRRLRRNPDTLTTVAIVGGVGLVGYLWWRSRQDVYAPALVVRPGTPSLTEMIIGTGQAIFTQREAAAAAAADKAAETRYYLTDRKQYGAPQDGVFTCIDKTTKRPVSRSVCDAIVNKARGLSGLGSLG